VTTDVKIEKASLGDIDDNGSTMRVPKQPVGESHA